jgi:flagellar biosynthesis anti-sigma factor FlgM
MIDRIQGLYGVQSTIKAAPGKSRASGVQEGGEGDAVSVSSLARDLASITGELKKSPEVREGLVEDIRGRIASGAYEPDLRDVAGRLVWAGILRESE